MIVEREIKSLKIRYYNRNSNLVISNLVTFSNIFFFNFYIKYICKIGHVKYFAMNRSLILRYYLEISDKQKLIQKIIEFVYLVMKNGVAINKKNIYI